MNTYLVGKFWRGNPSEPVAERVINADDVASAEAASGYNDTNHYAESREMTLGELADYDDGVPVHW